MNIKIPNNIVNLNESEKNLTKKDLISWLNSTFPDNAKNWKNATMEIVDCANWIYNEVNEIRGEKTSVILKDTTKSKTPSEWNIKHKSRIQIGFDLLSDYQQKEFFKTFGHWISKDIQLNESQEIKIEDESEIEDVLKLKKNQFQFNCGLYMGTIKSGLNNNFGLLWHVQNTIDEESFLNSVTSFIELSNNSLTQNDIERLNAHYNKYV